MQWDLVFQNEQEIKGWSLAARVFLTRIKSIPDASATNLS